MATVRRDEEEHIVKVHQLVRSSASPAAPDMEAASASPAANAADPDGPIL